MRGQRRRLSSVRLAVVPGVLLLCVAVGVAVFVATPGSTSTQRTCVYSADNRTTLREFDQLIGTRITCAVVFDDAAPTWTAWDTPWFTNDPGTNVNWTSFAAGSHNRMIITVNLFPTPLSNTDWRAIGAAGGYTGYARTLAMNLIRAHMGDATIRLGHEANGTWFPDSIGTTPAQWNQWKEFWRKTVIAMRSVPGAHFDFNWCIAAGYRAIPFSDYYPGDDVVDTIGVDVYDSNVPAGVSDRWSYVYRMPGGVAAIARFAHQHHKPLTIPEWGLVPLGGHGVGNDPRFMNELVSFVRSDHVAFQAYFFSGGPAMVLKSSPQSLSIYRSAFGADG
jgi:Glycosyl hydrolase family 26